LERVAMEASDGEYQKEHVHPVLSGHLVEEDSTDMDTHATSLASPTNTSEAAIPPRQQGQLGRRTRAKGSDDCEHPVPPQQGLWGFFSMTTSNMSRQRYSRYF
jgi:hypothetical protein